MSVTRGTLAASNYTFTFIPGRLTITKATPGVDVGSHGVTDVCSPNPSVWGETVTCTAALPSNATGQVSFIDGSVTLGTGTIVDERATFSTAQLAVATHSITALYRGDANYNGVSSAAISQVVNKATLLVIANDQQRLYGQANPSLMTTTSGFVNGDTSAVLTGTPVVTTTATAISSWAISDYGHARYSDGGELYLHNGNRHAVRQCSRCTRDDCNVVCIRPRRHPVTFTATVPAGATGTVQFYDGATLIGTGTVSGSMAALTTSTLALGTHSIMAVYSGDANFTTTSSLVLTQTITAPVVVADYNLSSNTPRQLIPPGASATYNIILTSMNAPFTNAVALTATGLPPGATYTFTPSSAVPGATGATSSFAVTVSKQTAGLRIRAMSPMALALLVLPWMWVKRKTSGPQRLLLWLLLSLTTLVGLSGAEREATSRKQNRPTPLRSRAPAGHSYAAQRSL